MMLANKLKEDEEEKLSLHHVNVQLLHFKYPMVGGLVDRTLYNRCIVNQQQPSTHIQPSLYLNIIFLDLMYASEYECFEFNICQLWNSW